MKRSYKIAIVAVVILIILVVIYYFTSSPTYIENKLKNKLRDKAGEIFETEDWLNGNVAPDTYIATLSDLENKLGKDISLFEKYDCDKSNTKVEFIVMEQEKAGQTNYKYNIILDCDF